MYLFMKWLWVWVLSAMASVCVCVLFGWEPAASVLLGIGVACGIYLLGEYRRGRLKDRGLSAIALALNKVGLSGNALYWVVVDKSKSVLGVCVIGDTKDFYVVMYNDATKDCTGQRLDDVEAVWAMPRTRSVDCGSRSDNIMTGWALGGQTGAWLGAVKPSGEVRAMLGSAIGFTLSESKYEVVDVPFKGRECATKDELDNMMASLKGAIDRVNRRIAREAEREQGALKANEM